MAATDVNRVIITGNLTARSRAALHLERHVRVLAARRLQHPPQGPVLRRVGRQAQLLRRDRVGRPGENCARFLAKGRPVAIDGRLEWRESDTRRARSARPSTSSADSVQFLGGRDDAGGGGNGYTRGPTSRPTRGLRAHRRACRRWRRQLQRRRRRHSLLDRAAGARSATLFGGRRPCVAGRRTSVRSQARFSTWRSSAAGRRAGEIQGRARRRARKSCPYCRDKVEFVDYRDIVALRKFISDRGKIRSRRITGACRRHQNQIATRSSGARARAAALRGRHPDVT